MSAQIAGIALVAFGLAYLYTPWALVVAGLLLIIVPELTRLSRRR